MLTRFANTNYATKTGRLDKKFLILCNICGCDNKTLVKNLPQKKEEEKKAYTVLKALLSIFFILLAHNVVTWNSSCAYKFNIWNPAATLCVLPWTYYHVFVLPCVCTTLYLLASNKQTILRQLVGIHSGLFKFKGRMFWCFNHVWQTNSQVEPTWIHTVAHLCVECFGGISPSAVVYNVFHN